MNKLSITEMKNGYVVGHADQVYQDHSVAKTIDEVCEMIRKHFDPVDNDQPTQPQSPKPEAPEEQEETPADTSGADAENAPVEETSKQESAAEWVQENLGVFAGERLIAAAKEAREIVATGKAVEEALGFIVAAEASDHSSTDEWTWDPDNPTMPPWSREWRGGDMPIDESIKCIIQLADGRIYRTAHCFTSWDHTGEADDIRHYATLDPADMPEEREV